MAQDLTPRSRPQETPVALVGATVHPVSGPPVEGGFVLFDKGRIVAVGKEFPPFPAGTRVIQARGGHVYPGLFAPFTQLGLTEIGAVRATRDFDEVGEITPEARAAVAVNPDSTLLPVARSNGVLTFAAFPAGGALAGRPSVMSVEGWTWEEMAILGDAGLFVSWPVPRRAYARWWSEKPEEEAKEDERIRETVERVRRAFAEARAYLRARDAEEATPADVRLEAMRPALRKERPVFFRADDYDQIVTAVEFAAKEDLRAVVVGGRDAHLCADLLLRHDVAVIVDGVHDFPKRTDSDFDEVFRLPLRLEEAGVRWCLGSGESAWNERNLPYAAARAAAHGLPRDAALRAITLSPARIFGLDGELGSLDAGKRATLLVTDGDPLEVTTRVLLAFVDGRELDLSNKQTALAAKYREKYR
jgi:imidazolonepropionase-like amidohydrolase